MQKDWNEVTPAVRNASLVRYEVTFTYVEPEYARQRGIEQMPYRGSFQVEAVGPSEALALAERAFREAETRSGVSWPREIRSSSCRVVPPSPTDK